jgi:hypothetical protein
MGYEWNETVSNRICNVSNKIYNITICNYWYIFSQRQFNTLPRQRMTRNNRRNGKTTETMFSMRLVLKAKVFRTTLYSLLKGERLSANIKLTLHKALIRSVMTYASPAWEFAADTHLMKLQRLQNKVLCTIGNVPRRTWLSKFRTYIM